MGKPYRRFRIKRGPNTWDNVTQSSSGTKISRSNKTHNTTTNVSRTRITTHQNNGGWVIRKSRSMFPKYKTKSSSSKRKQRRSSGKSIFDFLFSKKKKTANKTPVKSSSGSWMNSMSNAIHEEEKRTLSFEEKAIMIAEKQAAKARAAQEARKRPVTYVDDKEGLTSSQKRNLIIVLVVVIFIIQKCTG